MSEPAAQAGDRWVRAGGVVFGVGVIAVLVAVLPFFFGARNWPLPLNLMAGLVPPTGVGIALWGLVRNARQARAARPQPVSAQQP